MPKKKRLQGQSEKSRNTYVLALERLRTHNNQIISKIVPELIEEFSSNEEIPRDERLQALVALKGVISDHCESLMKRKPTSPPSLWEKRDRSLKESPSQFISRVYYAYLPGIVLADIRQLDFKLYRAFQNQKSTTGASLAIPTKSAATDKILSTLGADRTKTSGMIESSFESKLRESIRNRARKAKRRL
jgi:hypothetical protein